MTPTERAQEWIENSGDDTQDLRTSAEIMGELTAEIAEHEAQYHRDTLDMQRFIEAQEQLQEDAKLLAEFVLSKSKLLPEHCVCLTCATARRLLK